ncbi:OPT superfamily oligopeptide transporter [Gymnopus androsaceus JB14]|uniref:OPT superfamily oligopeptide transporter n=1 Tax=Gymnopus androsaceus JB14 TaxID=1447944 RepID=A0A6A4H4W7_9AGAR|nr:OPT superfamily oligopeptide transporter [Gymnopus androsaceus JB14]
METDNDLSHEKGPVDDEKQNDRSNVEVETADVFDDTRVIDLGQDGKERPIETDMDVATRLISLEDDPTLPTWTFRMWILGLALSCFGAVLGQIFYFRPQTVFVSQLFLQIIAYVLDIKEHVAITIFATTAAESALAISIFAADDLFYKIQPNVGIGIFTLIGSQLIGYGLGGKFDASIPSFIPPIWFTPIYCQLFSSFDALHRGKKIFSQKKRVRFFWGIFIGIFVWEWFPEYIAPTLTGISIFCLADRRSAWVTRIFGMWIISLLESPGSINLIGGAAGNEGLGMFALCLDWNYVGSGGGSMGALFTPFSTQASQYFGTMICIIAFCACYAANTWNAQTFPFLSQELFTDDGQAYDQLAILDNNFRLDPAKLAIQGLPWFASSQVLTKIGANLAIGATFTHVLLCIVLGDNYDPHYAKMKVYKEVPMWWYGIIFLASFAMAMATCYTGHSQLPWWGLIVAIILSGAFLPAVMTTYAVTGFVPDVTSLVQIIGASMMPGSPQTNMYFTLYASNTVLQARGLLRDLKMGQYTKLAPRVTFTVQTVGTIVGSNIWSGQQVQSFNSDAITWGALGNIIYSPSGRYSIVPMSILHRFIGSIALLDHPPILPQNRRRKGLLASTHLSFTTFLMAIFSQFYLRKYRPGWFRKYNFLLSAALDGGTQVMVFVFTFALAGGSGKVINFPNWALNPVGNPDYCLRAT